MTMRLVITTRKLAQEKLSCERWDGGGLVGRFQLICKNLEQMERSCFVICGCRAVRCGSRVVTCGGRVVHCGGCVVT